MFFIFHASTLSLQQEVGSEVLHIASFFRLHFLFQKDVGGENKLAEKSEIALDYEWLGNSIT